MSNGPPTPPPTGAEIQDQQPGASSSSGSVAETSSSAPLPAQDAYTIAFTAITSLAVNSQWADLIKAAELAELAGNFNERSQTRLLVTVPLILGYLIEDRLPAAKFAFIRLPDTHHIHPLVRELKSLLVATTDRRHALVYSKAEALFNGTAQATPEEQGLANVVATMLSAFVDAFRRRTVLLLSKAYVSIPLPLAQSYLGLPHDQLLAEAQAQNWTYDSSSQILHPKAVSTIGPSKHVVPGPSSLSTFDYVTTSVSLLET